MRLNPPLIDALSMAIDPLPVNASYRSISASWSGPDGVLTTVTLSITLSPEDSDDGGDGHE